MVQIHWKSLASGGTHYSRAPEVALDPSTSTKPLSSATRVLLYETVASHWAPTVILVTCPPHCYSQVLSDPVRTCSSIATIQSCDTHRSCTSSVDFGSTRASADSLSVFTQKSHWLMAARISIHSTAWRQFRPECPSPRSSLTTPQTMPRTRAPAPRPTSMSHPVTVKGQQ